MGQSEEELFWELPYVISCGSIAKLCNRLAIYTLLVYWCGEGFQVILGTPFTYYYKWILFLEDSL